MSSIPYKHFEIQNVLYMYDCKIELLPYGFKPKEDNS